MVNKIIAELNAMRRAALDKVEGWVRIANSFGQSRKEPARWDHRKCPYCHSTSVRVNLPPTELLCHTREFYCYDCTVAFCYDIRESFAAQGHSPTLILRG